MKMSEAEATEVVEAEPTEATAPDYESETADELDARMLAGEGMIQDEPDPEPEPIAAESDKDGSLDADPSEPSQEASSVSPPEDAPVAEPETEPLLEDSDLQSQELQLQIERIRQEREQFEMIAGRTTGEVGYLKQELAKLRAVPPPAQDDLDYPAETPTVQPQQQRTPSQLEGQVAELQEANRASAVERVYNEFLTQMSTDLTSQGVEQVNLETEQKSIMEQITPTLKQRFETFGDVSTMGTKAQEKITRMVLQGAYTDTKLAKVAVLRKQNSERKATQISAAKIVKQAASPSGSGGRPVKEPPPKSPEEMTWQEADAAMIAQAGERTEHKPRR